MKWSEVAQLCPTLCNPVDCSPPGSSVHGILQARILEWVAISFSRGSSQPRDRTQVSRIAGRHFILWVTREAYRLPIACIKIDFDTSSPRVLTVPFHRRGPGQLFCTILSSQVSVLASISLVLYPSEDGKVIIQLILSVSKKTNFSLSLYQAG